MRTQPGPQSRCETEDTISPAGHGSGLGPVLPGNLGTSTEAAADGDDRRAAVILDGHLDLCTARAPSSRTSARRNISSKTKGIKGRNVGVGRAEEQEIVVRTAREAPRSGAGGAAPGRSSRPSDLLAEAGRSMAQEWARAAQPSPRLISEGVNREHIAKRIRNRCLPGRPHRERRDVERARERERKPASHRAASRKRGRAPSGSWYDDRVTGTDSPARSSAHAARSDR